MKKVAEFIEGTFIDYKGDKREYTICALSCPIEEGDGDEYVRGIGMAEAERKAKENPFSVLRADTLGVINSTVVHRLFLNKKPNSLKEIRVNISKHTEKMQKDISMNWNLKKSVGK